MNIFLRYVIELAIIIPDAVFVFLPVIDSLCWRKWVTYSVSGVLLSECRKHGLAKERSLSLNQDDVIGSSIINRLVGLIVGIEPMKDDEKLLLVRPLKSWFSTFMPFTYTLKPGFYGGTVVKTDLAPASVSNSKIAVWNYLHQNFAVDEWFTYSQIVLAEIEGNVTEWQLRRILTEFVKTGKLKKRGATKTLEYTLDKNYSSEI